jgi:hypothetical protein
MHLPGHLDRPARSQSLHRLHTVPAHEHGNEPSNSIKSTGYSRVTERLVASQEGFSSTEIVILFTVVMVHKCSFCVFYSYELLSFGLDSVYTRI